jgi:peptide/nickel transport system substrate-binding protein
VIGAVETGAVDILGAFVSTTQVSTLEGEPGVTIVSNISHGSNLLHYNMRIESLSDEHMRRALTYLMPSQDMIDIIYEGEGMLVPSIILTPLWTDPSLSPVAFSVELALAELAAAGYVFGPDGTLYYPPEGSDNRVFDNS